MSATTVPVRITHGDLSADIEVLDMTSIVVKGLAVANTATTPVEVTFVDSNNVQILSVAVPCADTITIPWEFLAPKGIKAEAVSDEVLVTFFHTTTGA